MVVHFKGPDWSLLNAVKSLSNVMNLFGSFTENSSAKVYNNIRARGFIPQIAGNANKSSHLSQCASTAAVLQQLTLAIWVRSQNSSLTHLYVLTWEHGHWQITQLLSYPHNCDCPYKQMRLIETNINTLNDSIMFWIVAVHLNCIV